MSTPQKKRKASNLVALGLLGGGAVLVLLVIVLVVRGSDPVKDNSVIHLKLKGQISEVPNVGPFSFLEDKPPLTLGALQAAIRAAAEDQEVIGMVLEVNNPAVGAAQLQELEDAMKVFRASGKWSTAYLETAGEFSRGDGAYALACMADEVVLAPPGDINLVGIRAEVPFLKGLFEKIEVGVHMEQRYKYKNAANTFVEDRFTPEHREALAGVLDDISADIVTHIAGRRGKSVDEVNTWLAQGPFTSEQAKERGLVDELSYWDGVRSRVDEKSERDDALVDMTDYAYAVLESGSGPTIGYIRGAGQIARGSSNSFGDPTIGSDTIAKAFRQARKDEVKGVLFRVDSPGGSYIASDVIRREVELTREKGIPVVVSMGNLAASGGYFVAMDADTIIAQPGTITGSIGVLAGRFTTRRFFEKWLGITFDSYQTSDHADFFSNLDAPSDETKASFNGFLDRIYEDFVGKAAKGRNKSYDELHAVAQGRVWSGRDALEHGLVDELGGVHLALTRVKELAKLGADAEIELKTYPAPKTGLEQLKEAAGVTLQMPREARSLMRTMRRIGAGPGDTVLGLPFEIEL